MKSAKHGLRYLKQNTGNMPKWIYVASFSRWKPSQPFNLNFWFQNCWPEFCWGIEVNFCADGSWLWPCCQMASFCWIWNPSQQSPFMLNKYKRKYKYSILCSKLKKQKRNNSKKEQHEEIWRARYTSSTVVIGSRWFGIRIGGTPKYQSLSFSWIEGLQTTFLTQ